MADALSLPINSYDAADTEAIMEHIVKVHKGKVILVVGHSNTTPTLVKLLGDEAGAEINEASEFDRLYVVTVGKDGVAEA